MMRLVTLIVTLSRARSKVPMEKKPSVPPIPPLSVTNAHALEMIEDKLRSALDNCTDRYGSIDNELKLVTYIRSYAVKIFDLHLAAYSKYAAELKSWIPELKQISVTWTITCLANYTGVSDQEIRKYRTIIAESLDNEMALRWRDSANPLLAALTEPQSDEKQSSEYSASLATLAASSLSPLLVKVA